MKRIGIVPAVFISCAMLLWGCNGTPTPTDNTTTEETTGANNTPAPVKDEPLIMYGMVVDSMDMVRDYVEPNQVLSDLLLRYHTDYQTVIDIAEASKEVFDVRRFQSGKPYTILMRCDSISKASCLVYEITDVEYVVYNLEQDTIYRDKKPVETREKEAHGTISSSLYETLKESGASSLLALSLADVYAWAIDFYHLQEGDSFKVIYTENYVNGQSVGIEQIKASIFRHHGNDFYAFYYENDSTRDYFDENGNSLRKAFLKSPLKFGRITSPYNPNRMHPILKKVRPHLGVDYAAPHGTPILAVGDGVITVATYKRNNGNYVKIRHNSTYTTQYLHMSAFADGIKPGAKVMQGDVIGYIGSTGLATGPHVCFRFWKNGYQVDPLKIDIPPSEPIKEAYREDYEEHMKYWMERLKGGEVALNDGE